MSITFSRKIMSILFLTLFAISFSWSADVNETLVSLYARLADLQERTHKLEQNSSNDSTLIQLSNEVKDIKLQINQTQQISAIKQAGETPSVDSSSVSINLNHLWVIVAGILVMLMQLGFAFVEAGLTRAKNAVHTMTMNLMDYGIGMIAFWAFGFALMFGGVGAIDALGINSELLNSKLGISLFGESIHLIGFEGFFLTGLLGTPVMTFFFFQMVFAATANTICTGTLAERWRFPAFSISSFFMAGLIYPIFGAWVWGGGWLQQMGYLDFAGSSVVHMAGGVVALMGAKTIGARMGKFDAKGRSKAMPGHNLPYTFLGTFILAFGWFGFNAGSTLRVDASLGLIVVNTALASATGAISGMFMSNKLFGKPDPTFAANGMLAGLVAVTAGCAFVAPWAAAIIGAVAGVLVVYSVVFVEEKLKIDDPVGAISVHGTNGIWGTMAVGIFAIPELAGRAGLVYGGTYQILLQGMGVITGVAFFALAGKVLFSVIGKFTTHRASDAEQEEGLDLSEMGVPAYSKD